MHVVIDVPTALALMLSLKLVAEKAVACLA
jgi:hypothetical protein